MKRYFSASSWDPLLKLITAGICIFAIALVVYNPKFWTLVIMGGLVIGSAFFTVRGYSIEEKTLKVHRLGWTKDFDLQNIKDAKIDNKAMRRSWRLLGNGGLFGWIGTFSNSRLGIYKAYVTNRHRCVVIDLKTRKLVVSPSSATEFITAIKSISTEHIS